MLGSVLVGVVVIASALALPVALLAEVTTLALLIVFAIVNAALIGVKRRRDWAGFAVPGYVPWAGIILSLGCFAASIAGKIG